MAIRNSSLKQSLTELRRISEHRTTGSEARIRWQYKQALAELKTFIAQTYGEYEEDGKLTWEIMQQNNAYARFLEEVSNKFEPLNAAIKKEIQTTVESQYKLAYEYMVKGVEGAIGKAIGFGSITPAVLKRAVQNPVSGLTLKDSLEKNRQNVIYEIKRDITIGLNNGDRMSTMVKRVTATLDGDYQKAVNVVRTEVHRVREGGLRDTADSCVKGGIPMLAIWHNMDDERVRPAKGRRSKANHRIMEGKTIKIAPDSVFDLGSGVTASAPGQSGDASNDCRCRCFLEYEIDDEVYEKGVSQAQLENVILTEREEQAISRYVGGESYVLNAKLRHGLPLTSEEESWRDELDRALEKMPKYEGIVYRSITDYEASVEEILRQYRPNSLVREKSYYSTSKEIYDETMPLQFHIISKSGRDITKFNTSEKEILFSRKTSFIVENIEGNIIYLKEV